MNIDVYKRQGYIGDSITDPNCYGDNIKKYWDFLKEWLDITPYAAPFSDGIWYDESKQKFKMWYLACLLYTSRCV